VQHAEDFIDQGRVVRCSLSQKTGSGFWFSLQGRLEQLLQAQPALWRNSVLFQLPPTPFRLAAFLHQHGSSGNSDRPGRPLPLWLFEDQKEQVAVRIGLEAFFFPHETDVVPGGICTNQFFRYLVVLCSAAARLVEV
jgi:hypothetical protein